MNLSLFIAKLILICFLYKHWWRKPLLLSQSIILYLLLLFADILHYILIGPSIWVKITIVSWGVLFLYELGTYCYRYYTLTKKAMNK